jgi:hypothetical protein
MIRGKRIVASGLSLGLAVLFLAAAPTTTNLTVGEFASMVAARMDPSGSQAPVTPDVAADRLAKSGIKVKADLAAPLTTGDAADIFQQFGITIQSSKPDTLLGRDRATALVSAFGESFSARAAGTKPTSGAVVKTGGAPVAVAPSLEDLTDCQNLATVKECHTCCNALGFHGKTCGQTCSNSPKASASEPTP